MLLRVDSDRSDDAEDSGHWACDWNEGRGDSSTAPISTATGPDGGGTMGVDARIWSARCAFQRNDGADMGGKGDEGLREMKIERREIKRIKRDQEIRQAKNETKSNEEIVAKAHAARPSEDDRLFL